MAKASADRKDPQWTQWLKQELKEVDRSCLALLCALALV